MNNPTVITFSNLRQRTPVAGENALSPVQAKAKPFVASNAQGVLRKVKDRHEVAKIAAAAGKRTLAMLQLQD